MALADSRQPTDVYSSAVDFSAREVSGFIGLVIAEWSDIGARLGTDRIEITRLYIVNPCNVIKG